MVSSPACHRAWLLSLILLLSACGTKGPTGRPLQVNRISPGGGAAAHEPGLLFLNSRITIYFSEDLDPLSVTSDAVRLIRVGGGGGAVSLRRSVRSRSVVLEPQPPLTPTLDDGSLHPGQLYRLEIAGFPRTNAVTAKDRSTLPKGQVCYFRTVSADASETDLPHPFLPKGSPREPFDLRRDVLHVAAGGRLQLHFTLPVLPTSLNTAAFEVHRYRSGIDELVPKPPPVAIARARILSLPRPVDPYPGSTVELTFARQDAVLPGDQLWVRHRTEAGLRDYRGRPLAGRALEWQVLDVHSGPRPELLRIAARKGPSRSQARFSAVDNRLNFESHNGRIQPMVRREAGDGSHGVFHPKASMTLEPGQHFVLGNGQTLATGQAMNFRGISIDKGVTVTIRSDRPVQLRSTGGIRIAGTLRLETPVLKRRPRVVDLSSLADVSMYAPVTLVAAGTIDVSGTIVRAGGVPDGGCALALIAGGISKQGRIPEGTIGVAPSARVQVVGPELIVTDHLALSLGLPVGAKLLAEAVTDWYPLKQAGDRQVVAEVHERRGVTVLMQVAAPDPVDPDRPFLDPKTLPAPILVPTSTPLSLPANCHVRFMLLAEVTAGEPLPGLEAIVIRQQ